VRQFNLLSQLFVLHAEVVGFLALYAGTFIVVAALYVTLAVRGPLRDAAKA